MSEGERTRRRVLGDAHVDRARADETPFDAPFQALLTEAAWGQVWSRPGLSLRDRSLLTLVLLAALGQDHELALHLRATRRTGATEEEVREALLHVAVYAGIPRANRAFALAREVFASPAEDG